MAQNSLIQEDRYPSAFNESDPMISTKNGPRGGAVGWTSVE